MQVEETAIDEDERGGAVRVRRRKLERDVPTPRMTYENRAFDLDRIEKRGQVGDHTAKVITGRRRVCLAVPALIERENPGRFREQRRDEIEDMRLRSQPMQEDDRHACAPTLAMGCRSHANYLPHREMILVHPNHDNET